MGARTTLRAQQKAAGVKAAGIRGVAKIGGVLKSVRFLIDDEGKVHAFNITAGFVELSDDQVRSYQWVTRNYADSAATNLGYLRYQNVLAANIVPEHRYEDLKTFLADSRWDGVRDRQVVLDHYYPQG